MDRLAGRIIELRYPAQPGCLAASCATATAALLVAVLTSITIALFPHQVPLEGTPAAGGGPGAGYIAGGGCETCDRSTQ
jgi:hypothetical protein